MSDTPDTPNVVPLPSVPPKIGTTGGGNGNGRLAAIESRLASLEAHQQHAATKEDIQKIKTWVLAGILGGMTAIAGVVTAISRFFVS